MNKGMDECACAESRLCIQEAEGRALTVGWESWRAPVIQLLWRPGFGMVWGRETCGAFVYVDRASALSSASIWDTKGSLGSPGGIRRGGTGQGGNPAAKTSRVEQ